jgi:hypothetical protein
LAEVHEFSYAGRPLTGFDEFGCEWTVERVDGWNDGVGLRVQREVRSGADGEFEAQPLRQAREVSWLGQVLAPSHAALEQAARAFAALPLRGEVIGESEGLILSASAFVSEGQKFAHSTSDRGTYQLTVVASDPLLYAPPVLLSTGLDGVTGTGLVYPLTYPLDYGVPAGATPGAVQVPNGGTAPYWPALRIDGPVTNPVVTVNETGDWVRFNGSLTAGQWLEIDCQNRRVLLNGQVSQAAKVTFSGRWLVIPVGGAGMSFDADTADAASLLSIYACEGAYL